MSIILPTLAVAFAAFCVWLAVRIVNRRERWAKWTLAVIVILPVLNFLSIGPIGLLAQRGKLPEWTAGPTRVLYAPLWFVARRVESVEDAIYWYVGIWDDDE